jgi:hypothetical protein
MEKFVYTFENNENNNMNNNNNNTNNNGNKTQQKFSNQFFQNNKNQQSQAIPIHYKMQNYQLKNQSNIEQGFQNQIQNTNINEKGTFKKIIIQKVLKTKVQLSQKISICL